MIAASPSYILSSFWRGPQAKVWGLRHFRRESGGRRQKGRHECLYLSAVASCLSAVACCLVPRTSPERAVSSVESVAGTAIRGQPSPCIDLRQCCVQACTVMVAGDLPDD